MELNYSTFRGRLYLRYIKPAISPAYRRMGREARALLDEGMTPEELAAREAYWRSKKEMPTDPNVPAYYPFTRWQRSVNTFYWLFYGEIYHVGRTPNEAMKKKIAQDRQAAEEKKVRLFGPDPVQPPVASTTLGKLKFVATYAFLYTYSPTLRTFRKYYGIPWGYYDWKMVKLLHGVVRYAQSLPNPNAGYTGISLRIIRRMQDRKYHIRERRIPDSDPVWGGFVPPTTQMEDEKSKWRAFVEVTNNLKIDRWGMNKKALERDARRHAAGKFYTALVCMGRSLCFVPSMPCRKPDLVEVPPEVDRW